LLVGDAGGFVFPFTGEGLCLAPYTGMRASETICAYLQGQFPQEQLADKYKESLKKVYDISVNFNEMKKKYSKKTFLGKLVRLFKNSRLLRNIAFRYCRRHPDFVTFAIEEALDGDFSVKSIRQKFKKQSKSKKAN
jgi:flavin-dependent dehydrogenase